MLSIKLNPECAATVNIPHLLNRRAEIERVKEKLFKDISDALYTLPVFLRRRMAAVYAGVFNRAISKNKTPLEAQRSARAEYNLRVKSVRRAAAGWRFPMSFVYLPEYIDHHAKEILQKAIIIPVAQKQGREGYYTKLTYTYQQLAEFHSQYGIGAPGIRKRGDIGEKVASLESAILRMVCEDWIKRKLHRLAARTREQISIAMGEVGKQYFYVSERGMNEFERNQKSAAAFLDSFVLVNQETGDEINLSDAAEAGQANPENRRAELMIRANGLEAIANDSDMVGNFLTMTAPSKYHYNSGGRYNGATPRETHQYLQRTWVKARAALAKKKISFKGVRVVEPHKDACPHWHMLIFTHKAHTADALNIIKAHFTAEDSYELTSAKAMKSRFFAKKMDSEKGSAVAYLTKYISKNIDGYGMENETDGETDLKQADAARRVVAWSRLHGIRQFQFFGLASVTVWREIRRVRNAPDDTAINALIAATGGAKGDDNKPDWCLFEKLKRECGVSLITETARNQYAEVAKKVKGVIIAGHEFITHLGEWVRQPKPREKVVMPERCNGFETGGSQFTWTGGNNCNQFTAEQRISTDFGYGQTFYIDKNVGRPEPEIEFSF